VDDEPPAADFKKVTRAMGRFGRAQVRAARRLEAAAQAMNAFNVEWIRWKIQFCLTATDEEIAEADRLFFSA
jgi:hypothetical protein